jgi:hypothetical protein
MINLEEVILLAVILTSLGWMIWIFRSWVVFLFRFIGSFVANNN